MVRLFAALVVLAGIAVGLPAGAAAQTSSTAARHAMADTLNAQERFVEVHRLLTAPKDFVEWDAGVAWLTNAVARGKGPALYGLSAATLFGMAQDPSTQTFTYPRETAQFLAFFEMRMMAIAARCDDHGAIPVEIDTARRDFRRLYELAATISDADREMILDRATEWEVRSAVHDWDFHVCGRGVGYMGRVMEKAGPEGGTEIQDDSRPGRTIGFALDRSLIEFVSDETWDERRAAIRAEFRRHPIGQAPIQPSQPE